MSKAKVVYPVWLTTPEAARYLGIADHTLRQLADTGQLTAYRIGRVFRYQQSDLDRFIGAARVRPEAALRLNWAPPQVRKITTNKEQSA